MRDRTVRRLSQCESYNPEMKGHVSTIRELMPDLATGAPPSGLDPYPLTRYFLETALQMAPDSGQRLKLLDALGIAEFTCGVGEQRAGHSEQAERISSRPRSTTGRSWQLNSRVAMTRRRSMSAGRSTRSRRA